MNSGRNNKGFTLIELLVVIAIISLLSAIVMAGLQDARSKARNSYITQTIGQYVRAIELYQLDNNFYPTPVDSGDITTKSYCLGDYTTNRCGDFNHAVLYTPENSGLAVLSTYMSGSPSVTTSDIPYPPNKLWRGATYQCQSPLSGDGECTKFLITWRQEGSGSQCGFGLTPIPDGNSVICYLFR